MTHVCMRLLYRGRVLCRFHPIIPLFAGPFNVSVNFLPTECICPAFTGLSKRQLHSGDASQTGREGEEPDGGRHREGTRGVQRSTEGQARKHQLTLH